MKLSDCLNKSTRNKLKNLSSNPKIEILTDKDLAELMGKFIPTYKRSKGGAYKQRRF